MVHKTPAHGSGAHSIRRAICLRGRIPELRAVTQGATLDGVAANLCEVVALALEDESLAEIGLAPESVIIATIELEPAVA